MRSAKITSKGQVTIPKDVRRRLGVKEGDRIVFEFGPRRSVTIRPQAENPLGRVFGLLEDLGKRRPVSVEEMNQAIKLRAARKYGR